MACRCSCTCGNLPSSSGVGSISRHNEPPIGGWVLVRTLSDPTTDNRFPNVDTLYGAAYLLLEEHGPVVLTLPPISDRYFSVALHDAYFNNFEVVGTSSGDTQGARLLIVPPRWDGSVPSDVDRVIEAPTPVVNLYQRIFVHDASEAPQIHALQDQITLTPVTGGSFPDLDLSRWDIPRMRETADPVAMFAYAKDYIALNGWPAAGRRPHRTVRHRWAWADNDAADRRGEPRGNPRRIV